MKAALSRYSWEEAELAPAIEMRGIVHIAVSTVIVAMCPPILILFLCQSILLCNPQDSLETYNTLGYELVLSVAGTIVMYNALTYFEIEHRM